MADYWKSTPKYWCKHCSIYVRDTKLERTNHEVTWKHQSAVKRSLRELHRGREREEREKERARMEVERINGVVGGSDGGGHRNKRGFEVEVRATQEERQKQLEQLAEMGVAIPTELRGDMAMAGEWTVTRTFVVKESSDWDVEKKLMSEKETMQTAGRAVGMKRLRAKKDEEEEGEEALEGLFKSKKKKRERWGKLTVEDEELDKLLGGPLVVNGERTRSEDSVKREDGDLGVNTGERKSKGSESGVPLMKKEVSGKDLPSLKVVAHVSVKEAASDDTADGDSLEAISLFKKRKPKTYRQK